MKLAYIFSECEHNGDLANYEECVIACGGKILESYLNRDEECTIIFEVDNRNEFEKKFKHSDAYDFSKLFFTQK